METKIIKLPTSSVRKINHPKGTAYMAVVKVKDLPFEILKWDEISSKRITIVDETSEKIKQGILKNDGELIFKHRGIELSVKEVVFKEKIVGDTKARTLYLEFTDKTLHGITDGKFTLEVLKGTTSVELIMVNIWDGIEDSDLIVEMRNRH